MREIWQGNGLSEELLPVMQLGDAARAQPLPMLGGTPGATNTPGVQTGALEPLPADAVKELLDGLVKQFRMPDLLPRRSPRRLPPATPDEETPERLEDARQRRETQLRQAREAGLLE